MATIRLINSFYQPVKSSEIENETVNRKEMKLKPWNVKTVTCNYLSFDLSCLILMPKWKVQCQVVLSKVNAAMKFFLFLLGYMKLNI